MWRSHLRLALRSLRRDLSSTLLGGASLAVAVASCVLIALFVRAELSYNSDLPNADRLSVVAAENLFGGELQTFTSTPALLAGALVTERPPVEAATLTYGGGREVPVIQDADAPEQTVRLVVGDSLFFDVFQHPFVAGDPATALDAPDGLVLTASAARRLFGDANPVGQPLALDMRSDTLAFTVRGVVADPAGRRTLEVEAVGSFRTWRAANPNVGEGWGSLMYQTYVLWRPGATDAGRERALDFREDLEEWGQTETSFVDVPLTDLRLSDAGHAPEGFGGDPLFLKLFGAVAALILVLGAVNYVNLATARGARRAQEIGVRKALGAGRGLLVRQFLSESLVLSLGAALVGLGLAALVLAPFSDTFGVDLAFADLDGGFVAGLLLAAVAVGLVAGLYPAAYLSRFEPTRVLRGGAAGAAGEAFLSRTWLRRGLVAFQFAAAVVLIAATGAVAQQLDYARDRPMGFDPGGLAVVTVTAPDLADRTEAVKRAFERSPAVVATSAADAIPPNLWGSMTDSPDPSRPDSSFTYKDVDADLDYGPTLGFEMAAGRWPDPDNADDRARAVVVNEAFVKDLGWPSAQAAVGKPFHDDAFIAGVVKDFHFEPLTETISAVRITPHRPSDEEMEWQEIAGPAYSNVLVRFAPGREQEGLADVEAAWAELAPGTPFEHEWVADQVADLSQEEARLAKTFGFFAGVAVLIAALGLVGLAAYTAERRTKEVGIRKVLGASVGRLVALLSREYVALAAVAAAAALPLAVVLVDRWREGFAYPAPAGPGVFVLAALAALALAVVSVGVQAFRAARRDPSRTLRTD